MGMMCRHDSFFILCLALFATFLLKNAAKGAAFFAVVTLGYFADFLTTFAEPLPFLPLFLAFRIFFDRTVKTR
jgi:hypothetical protein